MRLRILEIPGCCARGWIYVLSGSHRRRGEVGRVAVVSQLSVAYPAVSCRIRLSFEMGGVL
jgi:hypothetical protein